MKIMLFFLLLATAVHSQETLTTEQEMVLDNLKTFYKQVGSDDKALWVDAQRKLGRIRFGPLESGTSAVCDMATGNITINSSVTYENLAGMVDLGETMVHEGVHLTQDMDTWRIESIKESVYLGNACEREAWEVGIRTTRRWAGILAHKARNAPSSRERAAAAARLEKVTLHWQTLQNNWLGTERKKFGEMTVRDDQGFPVSWAEMTKEREGYFKTARDSTVTSEAVTRSYEGSYRGETTSVARGDLNFNVHADNRIVGKIRGNYKNSRFELRIVKGKVDVDGNIKADLEGEITKAGFLLKVLGKASGKISRDGTAAGTWSAGGDIDLPSGNWKAIRQ